MQTFIFPQLGMVFGSPAEIGIIAGVILLLFGGTKVASFGKSVGEGIKLFKKEVQEDTSPKSGTTAAPVVSAVAQDKPVVDSVPANDTTKS